MLLAPLQAAQVSFRLIAVPTEAKAAELRARILAGESFEGLAKENSTDASGPAGGLMVAVPSDLRQELRTNLSSLAPGQISQVIRIGNEFYLLQLENAVEEEWKTENDAASERLQKGNYDEAAKSFLKAVQIAEKFGADDYRLGQSLNGLAEAYLMQ